MRDLDARRAPLLQSYRCTAHCATARRVVATQRRGCEARWAFARPLCRNPCLPRRYDGLASFVKFVCDRPYLGGWLLPQRRSYFVLKLAHDWCVERCCGGIRAVAKCPCTMQYAVLRTVSSACTVARLIRSWSRPRGHAHGLATVAHAHGCARLDHIPAAST